MFAKLLCARKPLPDPQEHVGLIAQRHVCQFLREWTEFLCRVGILAKEFLADMQLIPSRIPSDGLAQRHLEPKDHSYQNKHSCPNNHVTIVSHFWPRSRLQPPSRSSSSTGT